MTEIEESSPAVASRSAGAERVGAGPWVWAIALVALVAWLLSLRPSVDPDAWLHLRIGDELRSGEHFGVVPDPLVLLADRPYVPSQWASEVAGSLAYQAGGMVGVHALRWMAILVLVAGVYLTARCWASPTRAAGIVSFVTFATSAGWGERPQLAGLALEAICLWLWCRAWRDDAVPWLAIPLTWVWTTLHGSWLVGVASGALVTLVAGFELGFRSRSTAQRALVVVLSLLAAGATPLGPIALVQPFTVSQDARATVNEWQAPSWSNPLFVLVLIMAVVVFARSFRRLRESAPQLLIAAAAAALAANSVRTVAFGAVLMTPALARALQPRGGSVPGISRREAVPWGAAAIALLLIPGVVWGGPSAGPLTPSLDESLRGLPPGSHVSAAADSSGWVVWAHPAVTPLRDLRVEVYSDAVAQEAERFSRAGAGWQEYALQHDVVALVVNVGDHLDTAAAKDPNWRRAAVDKRHAVWVRVTS